jgi:hypothetical protein
MVSSMSGRMLNSHLESGRDMAQAKEAKAIKRPTKIVALTRKYIIQWFTEDEWYQGRFPEESMGYTERDKGLISIRADSTADEDTLRETLLHEVLHVCTQSSRFDRYITQVEDPEEFVVSQMSPVLITIMNDNPSLVAYLLSSGPPG